MGAAKWIRSSQTNLLDFVPCKDPSSKYSEFDTLRSEIATAPCTFSLLQKEHLWRSSVPKFFAEPTAAQRVDSQGFQLRHLTELGVSSDVFRQAGLKTVDGSKKRRNTASLREGSLNRGGVRGKGEGTISSSRPPTYSVKDRKTVCLCGTLWQAFNCTGASV